MRGLGEFLFAIRPDPREPPFHQRANLFIYYAVCLVSLVALPLAGFRAIRSGDFPSALFQAAYLISIAASLAVFLSTRRLSLARSILAIGVVALSAFLVAAGGGRLGTSLLYLSTTFSFLYFIFGFRGSVAFVIAFFAGTLIRFALGGFPASSLYADPSLRREFLPIFGISSALAVAALFYQDRLLTSLTRIAYTDPITRLANRARIAEDIAQATEGKEPFLLVALKIYQFGRISSYRGVQTGDGVLSTVGERILESLPPGAMAGRWSGTLFIIRLKGFDTVQARDWAKGLLERLHQPISVNEREFTIRPGVAITRYPDDGAILDRLISNLATTLEGGEMVLDKVRFFNEASWAAEQRRYAVANALKGAITRGELSLAYHPKIDLRDGSCHGAEVLARWNHPDLGEITPTEFIPIAEANGLIQGITEFVIDRFLADYPDIAACLGTQARGFVHAINLSPLDLANLDLPGHLTRQCAAAGLPPAYLELEITEGVVMSKDPQVSLSLDQLKASGFRLAIDDFGTGYSSLSYLHKLEADNLKIDQSFIRVIASDGYTVPIVDAIISMGKTLGMSVTAEGVETEDQAAFLKARSCDFGQGFLYAKPMPLDAYLRWLSAETGPA